MKRDVSIQIIRVLSMISIVACHLVKNHVIGQFLTFGIFTFLFISGFLYGNKKIDSKVKWLAKQLYKILLPFWVFISIILLLNYLINNSFDLKNVFIYYLNLQYFSNNLLGATHLWFITVICLCYILTVFKEKIINCLEKPIIFIIVFLMSCGVAYLNTNISNLLFMILTYFLGILFSKNEKNYSFKTYTFLIMLFVAIGIKLGFKHFFDDTPLYNSIIYSIVHFSLAFCFFNIIRILDKKIHFKSNLIIDFLDKYSFYIYITHYMFIVGPLAVNSITKTYLVNVLIVLICSLISSILLKGICGALDKIIKKNKVIKC